MKLLIAKGGNQKMKRQWKHRFDWMGKLFVTSVFLWIIPAAFAQGTVTQSVLVSHPYVDFTQAAEHAVNTVVHINAEMEQKNSTWDSFFSDPFFNFFNFNAQPQVYQAYGSGVILTHDGYIVTNNHVVDNAVKVTITLNDKRKFEAEIIGTDRATDLALLKINASNLDFISFGNSDLVRIGEWVLAVGNPYNLNSTVTAGIVSAKARNLNILGKGTTVTSFIQTDAAVNSGNSGGALVNVSGELIGINAAIASNTGSYAGYSFAIPVNVVKKVVDDLKRYGRVQHVHIGASFEEVTSEKAADLGLKEVKGLQVSWLEMGGSLEKAGVEKGDVLLRFDGREVNSASEIQEVLEQKVPGDEVRLTVFSNGKEKNVKVVLLNQRGNTDIITSDDNYVLELLGAELEPISAQTKSRYRVQNGVTVSHLKEGLLKKSGIQEGFTILSVDGRSVGSKEDIRRILNDKKGNVQVEGFYPNGFIYYYNITL